MSCNSVGCTAIKTFVEAYIANEHATNVLPSVVEDTNNLDVSVHLKFANAKPQILVVKNGQEQTTGLDERTRLSITSWLNAHISTAGPGRNG